MVPGSKTVLTRYRAFCCFLQYYVRHLKRIIFCKRFCSPPSSFLEYFPYSLLRFLPPSTHLPSQSKTTSFWMAFAKKGSSSQEDSGTLLSSGNPPYGHPQPRFKLFLPNFSLPLWKHFRQAQTVLEVLSNTVTILVLFFLIFRFQQDLHFQHKPFIFRIILMGRCKRPTACLCWKMHWHRCLFDYSKA